jgi:biopolymer transport protein ExbD
MPLKTHHDDQPALNLTPMIDVLFLLIIFFMVATKFSEMERSIEVRVPEVARPGAMTAAPDKRVVNVHSDGTLDLDRQPLTLDELGERLSAARAEYHALGVVVRGDAGCPFQHVADVLATCRSANIAELDIAVRVAANTEPISH